MTGGRTETRQRETGETLARLFDRWYDELPPAELCCLLYIARQTVGRDRDHTTIPLDEFAHGAHAPDGTRRDRGTGLDERTITGALANLQAAGYAVQLGPDDWALRPEARR